MEILICTDGSDSSVQSAELILKLGFPASSRIIVLAVSQNQADVDKLTSSMDLIDKKLGKIYSISRKIRHGNPIEEILAEALEFHYDLVAMGGGGGQLGLLHPQLGSTTSNLARKLHTHFLVARNIPAQFGKVLVCTGADTPASETIKLGGAWISNTSARIGLLHVIAAGWQAQISDNKIGENGNKSPIETGARYDTLLKRAGQQLRDAGIKNEITYRIRHGLVVDEVLNELAEGGYELLVVGAHYQPGQDRWQGTLLDDITDQLLNRSTCSVLII